MNPTAGLPVAIIDINTIEFDAHDTPQGGTTIRTSLGDILVVVPSITASADPTTQRELLTIAAERGYVVVYDPTHTPPEVRHRVVLHHPGTGLAMFSARGAMYTYQLDRESLPDFGVADTATGELTFDGVILEPGNLERDELEQAYGLGAA